VPNAEPSFSRFTEEQIASQLLEISGPAVIFVWSGKEERCITMRSLLERIANNGVGRRVRFWWVDAEKQQAVCRVLSVTSAPTVLIFDASGQEISRFTCPSSKAGIRYHLAVLLASMREPRARVPEAVVPHFG
jgi:thioredoxin-like negative regulator of GroEL